MVCLAMSRFIGSDEAMGKPITVVIIEPVAQVNGVIIGVIIIGVRLFYMDYE